MKPTNYHIVLFCLLTVALLNSCTGTRYLDENQTLYLGADIIYEDESLFPSNKDKNELTSALQKKLYPKANKKFLGLFHTRVWLFNRAYYKQLIRASKGKKIKSKGFRNWIKTKVGKEPILVEDIDIEVKENLLVKSMQDQGYFKSTIKGEKAIKKDKMAKIQYSIKNPSPTYIDTIHYPQTNSQIDRLINQYEDFEMQENKIYKLKHLKSDRDELALHIREQGYYDFDKNSIVYLIDTSSQDNNYDMSMIVKPPTDSTSHQKYYIRKIHIYPTWNVDDTEFIRSTNNSSPGYVGLNYYIKENYRYTSRKIFKENIFISTGSLFNLKDYQLTSSRLINLGLYKYVNINYDKVKDDSLDVTIKLTPTQYQNVKTSVEVSSSSRGYLGSSLGFTYNNRNIFHWAVDLKLSANVGTELQFISGKPSLNILDVNFELDFSLPRRLRAQTDKEVGRNKNKFRSTTIPRTTFGIAENFEKWIQYYTMNDLNFEFNYEWAKSDKNSETNRDLLTHSVTPLNLSWLYLINTTAEFDNLLSESTSLRESFQDNFIIGSKYTIVFDPDREKRQRNSFELRGTIESSGNLAFLIGKAFKPNNSDKYEILGIPISEFFSLDLDTRNHWKINEKSALVSRINVGIGIALGNSDILPYSRQFFMGGPNTIRAFKFRTIGPGRYSSTTFSESENPVEQTGDIKLLLNLEHRYTIYKFIKGATFVDAGNIWLLRADEERPDGEFDTDFIKQIALGAGIGLRLDFDFFAIRLDLGVPLYKPNAVDGERWFHEYPASTFKNWRRDNFAWNFAIGYPF